MRVTISGLGLGLRGEAGLRFGGLGVQIRHSAALGRAAEFRILALQHHVPMSLYVSPLSPRIRR